jgi:hypothetical protein
MGTLREDMFKKCATCRGFGFEAIIRQVSNLLKGGKNITCYHGVTLREIRTEI